MQLLAHEFNGVVVGGVLGDVYNIRRPFEVAFFLYVASTIYGALFLPTGTGNEATGQKPSGRGLGGFFAPIKVIVPHKYRLESGAIVKNYGLVFLALGIFLGVVSHNADTLVTFNPRFLLTVI